jgi:hypothetical protein
VLMPENGPCWPAPWPSDHLLFALLKVGSLSRVSSSTTSSITLPSVPGLCSLYQGSSPSLFFL